MKQGKGIISRIKEQEKVYLHSRELTIDNIMDMLFTVAKAAHSKPPEIAIGAGYLLSQDDETFALLCTAPNIQVLASLKSKNEIEERMKRLGMIPDKSDAGE